MNDPALEIRGRAAPAHIARLLNPTSIAVIGASADLTKFSGRFIRFLVGNKYRGAIYPINARRDEIMGLRCYPDLASVGDQVDCVVYTAGAEGIAIALEACAAKKIDLLVVTSTGFGESGGEEGKVRERMICDFARRTGIRVLGPNCVGFANFVDGVTLAAAAVLDWQDMPRGSIGLASQSGGLSFGTILFNAFEELTGFSHVVSTGNEADLDVVDFARFFVEDQRTDVIALTLEAVRDGRGFCDMLEAAQRADKPVVVLKAGRSALGQTMAASHTGALAGSDVVFDAICTRYGATRVDDVDELFQIAQMFAKLRRSGKLAKARPLIAKGCSGMSVSGGHIGHLADLGSLHGVEFPPLAPATQQRLREGLGADSEFLNPVDLSGGRVSDHSIWGKCLEAMLDDPSIRISVPVLTIARNYDPALHDFIRIASNHEKVVLVIWAGGAFDGEGKRLLRRSDVPVFATTSRAVKAIASLEAYLRARHIANSETRKTKPTLPYDATVAAAEREGRAVLGERESKAILGRLGFPVVREILVNSADEAMSAAAQAGFPVALKGEHPDILHKTEAGIVRLDLSGSDEVAKAYNDIERKMSEVAPRRRAIGVLVQEMVPSGIEMVLGVRRDPIFGPMVMFGLGGVFVEVFKDVAFRPAPLRREDADAMIRELRGFSLLQGARGRQPINLERLAGLLVELGDFALAHREAIREIDINPMIAINRPADNLRIVDALIVLGA